MLKTITLSLMQGNTMTLKVVIATVFLTHLITQCCETTKHTTTTHSVTIRQALPEDIDTLNAISYQQYINTFKPMWKKHYETMTPAHHTVDSFVQEKINSNNTTNKNFITQQQKNKESNQKLLIAKLKQDDQEHIAGYCRFEKKDIQTMYINFIVVAENFQKLGIAKFLAQAAMNSFDDVTECKFRALAHYDFINDLYTKHGCQQTGTISLDPTTGQVSTDPNAPITHIDYSYTIKK